MKIESVTLKDNGDGTVTYIARLRFTRLEKLWLISKVAWFAAIEITIEAFERIAQGFDVDNW